VMGANLALRAGRREDSTCSMDFRLISIGRPDSIALLSLQGFP
jgi:hypothetical protein